MGVHGLSTFMDDNKNIFLSDHKLYDTRVVIDGSNLFHFLYYHYKISHQFGGDYDHFARKCKGFFNILKECNVTPFVIFDGGYDPDDRKLPTVLNRMNDRRKKVGLICAQGRGCVLPILSYETFLQVLVELNVAHAACVYEADREIAVLAKKWKCPVLSNDSDFFVYSLEGGFMPLDYINLTLCLYNTQTGVASVLGQNTVAGENEFVYIPVKFYRHERLLKVFNKVDDKSILPMFATVVGNDYVDYSVLYNFHTMLHAPKNPSKKSICAKTASSRMAAVLHWMENTASGEEALQHVLASIAKEKKESVTEIVVKSVNEYKNIEEFAYFDLESILSTNQTDQCLLDGEVASCEHIDCDSGDGIAAGVSELRDYYKRQLPAWFVRCLRNCKINGSFLQNVSVLHRVLFNCQVEMLEEISSYACSRDLRAFIYAIVLHPVEQSESGEPSRDNSVEEYDRLGMDTKKFYVQPTDTLQGFSGLPNLKEIPSLSKMERKKLLFAGFGITVESLDKRMDDSSQLLVLVLSLWIKNAQPKPTEGHLSALIICVLALHINTLDWLNATRVSRFNLCEPELYGDVVKACEVMDESRMDMFKKQVEKYFSKPEHSVKIPRDNKVVHGFAQFQTCFLNSLYLNQVLLSPVCVPSPSVILNCTFVYNLCRSLESREHPELYIKDILTRDSPLHRLYTTWKDLVIDLCKGNSFGDKKTKSKTKQKSKKSRTKKEAQKGRHLSSDEEDEGVMKSRVTLNCDVSNKFALLDLGDSA